MKVSGTATLHAGRDEVWRTLNDPAVLVRTIPGCQRLEETGPDAYRMTVTAGVASIKGTYTGDVRLTDQHAPDSFVLSARGAGGPGTVSAEVLVGLTESGPAETTLTYDADAVVGGVIGGVGQRMLSGVAKKTAGEFFGAVDQILTGQDAGRAPVGAGHASDSAAAAATTTAAVYQAPGVPASGVAGAGAGFVPGALVGAAAALIGVLVGGWLRGRRDG